MNTSFLLFFTMLSFTVSCVGSENEYQTYLDHRNNISRIVQHINNGQSPPESLGKLIIPKKLNDQQIELPDFNVPPTDKGEIGNGWTLQPGKSRGTIYHAHAPAESYISVYLLHLATGYFLEYRWFV